MPNHDSLDRFVALSKCLSGLPDWLINENCPMVDKLVSCMDGFLDDLQAESGCQPRMTIKDAQGHAVQVPGPTPDAQAVAQDEVGFVMINDVITLRDQLFVLIEQTKLIFARGVSFEELVEAHLEFLPRLSQRLMEFDRAVRQYQAMWRQRTGQQSAEGDAK